MVGPAADTDSDGSPLNTGTGTSALAAFKPEQSIDQLSDFQSIFERVKQVFCLARLNETELLINHIHHILGKCDTILNSSIKRMNRSARREEKAVADGRFRTDQGAINALYSVLTKKLLAHANNGVAGSFPDTVREFLKLRDLLTAEKISKVGRYLAARESSDPFATLITMTSAYCRTLAYLKKINFRREAVFCAKQIKKTLDLLTKKAEEEFRIDSEALTRLVRTGQKRAHNKDFNTADLIFNSVMDIIVSASIKPGWDTQDKAPFINILDMLRDYYVSGRAEEDQVRAGELEQFIATMQGA